MSKREVNLLRVTALIVGHAGRGGANRVSEQTMISNNSIIFPESSHTEVLIPAPQYVTIFGALRGN